MAERGGGGRSLSAQDWEQIIQDFRTSFELQAKWMSLWPGLSLLEQAIYTLTKREVLIKSQLFVFIEENAEILLKSSTDSGLGMLLDSMRGVLSSLVDGTVITNSLKESMMVMVTAVAIVTDSLHNSVGKLEGLVELFLGLINRTNSQSDRHVRGLACDCLRELEIAYPCLLHACVGHVHQLNLNERTHAGQSYTLLLTELMHNLSCHMYTLPSRSASYQPILHSSLPLIPFSTPAFLVSSSVGEEVLSIPARELTQGNLKEFRKVVAFLLERPRLLSTVGMLPFVANLIDIFEALDLSGSLLKHQFSSFLSSYSPVLCHIVLMIHTHFQEPFESTDASIVRRLILLSKDSLEALPFRLLGVHWLLGIETLQGQMNTSSGLASCKDELHPLVFDPLSLKAAKLEAIAHSVVDLHRKEEALVQEVSVPNGKGSDMDPASKCLKKGLLAVSSYRWLPPWSTETQLAFHVFHRFLTVAIPHCSITPTQDLGSFTSAPLFQTLLEIFVDIAIHIRKLVPSLLALLDRLLACDTHRGLGDKLLQTYNERLLPQLRPDRHLPSYFPVLERIAESSAIPPTALIEKLTLYMYKRVKEEDWDSGWASWRRSSQVLGICRSVLLHHQSSRAFRVLSELLAYLCCYFPDIEVRDTARLYLRMLISIPGNRLRSILKYGDERVDEANAPQLSNVSSLLRSPSPPTHQGYKKRSVVASYIHLRRVTPLLVRHSWSLVLYNAFNTNVGFQHLSTSTPNPLKGTENKVKEEIVVTEIDAPAASEDFQGHSDKPPQVTLRVMDARTSEILLILRRHFAEIPDYFNGPGVKIKVKCTFRFQEESRHKVAGEAGSSDSPTSNFSFSSIPDSWPAIYAVVITFSTTGTYRQIPAVHVPFLLSEPMRKSWGRSVDRKDDSSRTFDRDRGEDVGLKGKGKLPDEEPVWSHGHHPNEQDRDSRFLLKDGVPEQEQPFCENIVLELEPKQPVPVLVDAHVVFSDEEGHSVSGQLDSIPIGIEDLFVKPTLPSDLLGYSDVEYLLRLFNALWDACGGPGRLGTETFSLKGGLESVAIEGSESVKLLEAQADRVMEAVEHYLAPFVVAVNGGPLVTIAKDGGLLEDLVWQEEDFVLSEARSNESRSDQSSLQIELRSKVEPSYGFNNQGARSGLGTFLVLIFLPPRFHLLLRMEVADQATLVRIRTDHWPSLAHIDEYLESLTMAR